MDLARVEQVNKHVELNIDDPGKTPFIADLIKMVSAAIERYLDRQVLKETDKVEFFNVEPHQSRFYLSAYPVASIADIWNSEDSNFPDGDKLDLTDTVIFDKSGETGEVDLRNLRTILIPGFQTLKIQYTGGMATDTDDFILKYPDLNYACIREVVYRFLKQGDEIHVSSSAGGGAVTFDSPVHFARGVREILDLHKRGF